VAPASLIAIYLRISYDPDNLAIGVERQRKDCLAIASVRYPDTPTRIFTDNDTSAYSSRPRPQYTAMLAMDPPPAAIIAWNLDRLLRQPRDLEHLIDRGIPVITATGDLDLTTHDGQLHARILAAVAKKASDDTSRRTARALREISEAGGWPGCAPFPYSKAPGGSLALDQDGGALVQRAVGLALSGASLRSIARDLSHLHPAAPKTPPGWRRTLTSPAIAGINRQNITGQWEPVIDHSTYAQLVQLYTDRSRSTTPTRARKHWISGLLRCGKCGSNMVYWTTVRNGTRRESYLCHSCHGVSITKSAVEDAVASMLFLVVKDRRGRSPRPVAPIPPQQSERLEELARLYVEGAISRAEWESARKLAQPSPESQPPEPERPAIALQESWPELSAEERHHVARKFLQYVVVGSADGKRVFDVGRLHPVWQA
jgi:site-specific DNA recombinase